MKSGVFVKARGLYNPIVWSPYGKFCLSARPGLSSTEGLITSCVRPDVTKVPPVSMLYRQPSFKGIMYGAAQQFQLSMVFGVEQEGSTGRHVVHEMHHLC